MTTNKFKTEDRQSAASRTVAASRICQHHDIESRGLGGCRPSLAAWLPPQEGEHCAARTWPSRNVQGDLWCRPDKPRSKALMQAMDTINAEYGRNRLKLAVSGIERGWRLRSEQRSPHYTTNWDELLMEIILSFGIIADRAEPVGIRGIHPCLSGPCFGCTDQAAGSSCLSAPPAAAVACTLPGLWWAGA